MPANSGTKPDFNIRLSPFVFIKRLVITEFIFAFITIGLSFIFDYSALLGSAPFGDVIPINLIMGIVLSLFQIFVIAASFLSWYFESYTLRDTSIVHRSGGSLGERELVTYQDIKNVSFVQNWLETSYNFGTLKLTVNGKKSVIIKNIPNPAYYARLIREKIPEVTRQNYFDKDISIPKLLKQKEGKNLEFKSSFFWDYKLEETNKELRKAIVKNVAALMNTEGGIILVGIDDNGKVLGLAKDVAISKRGSLDSVENMFNQSFTAMIGAEFRQYMDIKFVKHKNLDLCQINVYPSPTPVYLINGNGEEFYIRTGNSSQPLSIRQAVEYIKTRF